MSAGPSPHRVAVVGATGAVGGVMLDVLAQRGFPAAEVIPFASARSAGRTLSQQGRQSVVRPLEAETIEGFDVALFSAGSGVSADWAPRFAATGCLVIDNSSHWRMQPDVPLVIAEVNPQALDDHRGIVANPNCSTMQMVVALKPIHDAVGLERLVVSTYQSTSGTGVRAVAEMMDQARRVLDGAPQAPPQVYPHRIAFNVLPQVETFKDGDDYTTEERKMIAETRKILGLPRLRVSATCARVPVRIGHSQSVNVETRAELSPEDARELLGAAPGVRVLDDPANAVYPLPTDAEGGDDVLVGRIRRDPSNPRTLNLWIVGDNLRKGAALNAVQLAELAHARGLLEREAARPRG